MQGRDGDRDATDDKRKAAWKVSGVFTSICLAFAGIAWAVNTKPVPRQVTTTEYHVQGSYSWWFSLAAYSCVGAIMSMGYAITTQIRSWIRRKWQERKRDRLATQIGSSGHLVSLVTGVHRSILPRQGWRW